ncbi:MAG TPA: VWA domain-containing protein [Polyangia bacterium]|nr:VWA domain-containing protein [Polyangia bacterium]
MAGFAWGGFVLGGLPAGALAAVAAGGAAILTGLYLLKLERRRVLVAFSPLWTALAGERRSERWARRLRRWLSLLLQLAFLTLLVLAAADPRPAAADRGGRSIVVLIDRSASMAARDEPGGRIARARRAAEEIVAGMSGRDRAMIISFGAGVSPESGFEDDPQRLRAAIARADASDEPGDLPAALEFARAVLRDRPRPTLVLISDGGFSESARAAGGAALAGIDARFVPVGQRRDNVAILSFGARRKPADPASVEAAVVVQSFRAAATTVILEIAAGPDSVPIERIRLKLEAGEQRRYVLGAVPAADTELRATLRPAGVEGTAPESAGLDQLDDLAVDDRAFAVVPALRRLKVLRVGAGDLFVDGALLSLGDTVDVRRVPAAAAASTRASWPAYDAIIFDGVTPPEAPTAGHFLFIDPSGPGSPFPVRGTIADPIVSESKPHHPLLRHVALADVNIARAQRLALAADDIAVASALGAPLIVARARPGLRVVALAFSVRQSDLPMRTAFPLLLANSIAFLAGDTQGAGLALRTGQAARWPVADAAGAPTVTATVIDPLGNAQARAARAGAVEWPVQVTGFYRLRTGRSEVTFAANLADPVESDTAPARTLALGGRTLPAPDAPRPGQRRAYWAWALMAAAALTLFEWCSYHRRWTV